MPHDDIPNMFGRGTIANEGPISSINLASTLFIFEARFTNYFSYSFVWDEVWTEANAWKVWSGCKDGTLSFSSSNLGFFPSFSYYDMLDI